MAPIIVNTFIDLKAQLERSLVYKNSVSAVIEGVFTVYYESFDDVVEERRTLKVHIPAHLTPNFSYVIDAIKTALKKEERRFDGNQSCCYSSTFHGVQHYELT